MNMSKKMFYELNSPKESPKEPWMESLCDYIMMNNLSKCLTIIMTTPLNASFFLPRRWSSTVSTGCMISWLRSRWWHPPTSTLAPCFWEPRSLWVATSSSPPPSSLWSWEISCSEFSQMWNRAVGMRICSLSAWEVYRSSILRLPGQRNR